jgi:hypothetical protein
MDKKEIKSAVLTHIRAGNNYSQTKEKLEKDGIKYPGLKTSFYKWKQEIFPEDARQGALQTLADRKKNTEEKKSTPKNWNKGKQKEADESVFAAVLNDAIFYFIPCPQDGLKIEDVQKINVGGSVVGLVTFYTDINLSHPIIVFVTRTIMLVIKIRNMCYKMEEAFSEAKKKAKEALPGQGSISSK